MFQKLPDLSVLQSLFTYDAEVGTLVPIKPRRNWRQTEKSGYNTIRIGGKRYAYARLCYLMGTGIDPGELEIDHIDRNPCNNRLTNLRLATRSEQLANRKRTSKVNLPKGVTYNKQRNTFAACWGRGGSKFNCPGFRTAEEAELFYLWQTRCHGDFSEPLPVSACPPRPFWINRNKRRRSTAPELPKGISYVRRRNSSGELKVTGFQVSYQTNEGQKTTKKFKTLQEAECFKASLGKL